MKKLVSKFGFKFDLYRYTSVVNTSNVSALPAPPAPPVDPGILAYTMSVNDASWDLFDLCVSGGAVYKWNPVHTYSLKAPGFTPGNYIVISWFQTFAFKINWNRYRPACAARCPSPKSTSTWRRTLPGGAVQVEFS